MIEKDRRGDVGLEGPKDVKIVMKWKDEWQLDQMDGNERKLYLESSPDWLVQCRYR